MGVPLPHRPFQFSVFRYQGNTSARGAHQAIMLLDIFELFCCQFVSGNIVDLAEQYGGLIFGVEHRYYGLSVFEGSLETENLVYLSSQQA